MPQTDFTKAFPPDNEWGSRHWCVESFYNPVPYTICTPLDEIEAEDRYVGGWRPVVRGKASTKVVVGYDPAVNSAGLTKDPTDWEPDLADQEFEEGLRKKKRALNTNWEPER